VRTAKIQLKKPPGCRTPAAFSGFNLASVMRDAQYPARAIAVRDLNGNPLSISY
jgi:hypothetical protein